MNFFRISLTALAATFTISTAHADGQYHTLKFSNGLQAMLLFVGTETPMSAYPNPDHPDLVRFAWDKTDAKGDSDGTYHDYIYCDSTKPNQPIGEMSCHVEFDSRSPNYQLFKNDSGMDK